MVLLLWIIGIGAWLGLGFVGVWLSSRVSGFNTWREMKLWSVLVVLIGPLGLLVGVASYYIGRRYLTFLH